MKPTDQYSIGIVIIIHQSVGSINQFIESIALNFSNPSYLSCRFNNSIFPPLN